MSKNSDTTIKAVGEVVGESSRIMESLKGAYQEALRRGEIVDGFPLKTDGAVVIVGEEEDVTSIVSKTSGEACIVGEVADAEVLEKFVEASRKGPVGQYIAGQGKTSQLCSFIREVFHGKQ